MTRRALGRGLSALLPDIQATASEELSEIDIDLIEPNSLQPRTNFDNEQLENLAQSIRANGIIQPLLVRRLDEGRYQLIAGERRWRAAQKAELRNLHRSRDGEYVRLAGTVALPPPSDKRVTGAQDLAWALINSPAFLFNH